MPRGGFDIFITKPRRIRALHFRACAHTSFLRRKNGESFLLTLRPLQRLNDGDFNSLVSF